VLCVNVNIIKHWHIKVYMINSLLLKKMFPFSNSKVTTRSPAAGSQRARASSGDTPRSEKRKIEFEKTGLSPEDKKMDMDEESDEDLASMSDEDYKVAMYKMVRSLVKSDKALQKRIKTLEDNDKQQNQAVLFLQNRIEFLEKKQVERKLRISGIADEEGEEKEKLFTKVNNLIKDVLKIETTIKFDEIRRIGRQLHGKPRPILVTLNNYEDKFKIFNEKKKCLSNLKGMQVYIDQELTVLEAAQEKALRNKAKYWKSNNKEMVWYIRKGILATTLNGKKTCYKVNCEGVVEPITDLQ